MVKRANFWIVQLVTCDLLHMREDVSNRVIVSVFPLAKSRIRM